MTMFVHDDDITAQRTCWPHPLQAWRSGIVKTLRQYLYLTKARSTCSYDLYVYVHVQF